MTKDPSDSVLLRLTRSGRPLSRWAVVIDGGRPVVTDSVGRVSAQLRVGLHHAVARKGDQELTFQFSSAAGLRELQVDLRTDEKPLDDDEVVAAMPSGRYIPLAFIGKGAMGSVFKCRDTVLDRLVAIKLLNADVIEDDSAREAFLAEGRALAAVESENLIRIHDLGVLDGRAFLVMQFIDGPDLEEIVRTSGPLPLEALCAAGAQLARALTAVHRAGSVHQDMKPSNALVDADGRVFLGDFGLAAQFQDVHQTRNEVAGTPAFMSPELVGGQSVGPASDVYALGATLFWLATGRAVFTGQMSQILYAHARLAPPALEELRPDAPDALASLLAAMLTKSASERPTAGQVERTLLDIAPSEGTLRRDAYLPRLSTGPGTPAAYVEAHTVSAISVMTASAIEPLGPTRTPGSTDDATLEAIPQGTGAGTQNDIDTKEVAADRLAPGRAARAPLIVAVLGILLLVAALFSFRIGDEPAQETAPVVPAVAPTSAPEPATPVEEPVPEPVPETETETETETLVPEPTRVPIASEPTPEPVEADPDLDVEPPTPALPETPPAAEPPTPATETEPAPEADVVEPEPTPEVIEATPAPTPEPEEEAAPEPTPDPTPPPPPVSF